MGNLNFYKLFKKLSKFNKNTKKTRKEIEELQKQKLQKLLLYAYENSKYYKNEFDKAGLNKEKLLTCSIKDIPKLNKRILLNHFDEIITTEKITQEELKSFDSKHNLNEKAYKGKYHCIHSSGTTGTPAYFIYDNNAWNEMLLAIIRTAIWNMSKINILKLLINKPRIAYVAAVDGRYAGVMAVGEGIDYFHAESIHLDIKKPISQWGEMIKDFKPNVIIGYPSAMKILGELIEKENIKTNVIRVITCGEPLNKGLREYLEKVFNTDVANVYGASESLVLGVEVSPEEGIVLFDDLNYIELVAGEMYLTCLYNYAQPLIRYRITDKLVIKRNSKGKTAFTKVETITGREDDILNFDDGKGHKDFLHPLSMENFLVSGIIDYQFKQIDKTTFEIVVEAIDEKKKSKIKRDITSSMNSILKDKNLEYVKFNIVFVDKIAVDLTTGKKKLIVK